MLDMESVCLYKCTYDSCCEKDEPEYEIGFAEELVDDRNLSDMFCPKCNSKLQSTTRLICGGYLSLCLWHQLSNM
jgi:hypothetical protein